MESEIIRIGFTGTAKGMTRAQKSILAHWLPKTTDVEFHHGDCIGADAEAHKIVRQECTASSVIIVHPPDIDTKRAFCEGDVILDTFGYIARNHDIVDAVTQMVATPKGFQEELRSGTWATIRYAKKRSVPVTIIWPDGTRRQQYGD